MMHKQRGMAQGWMLLIGIIVLVSAVTAGIVALNAYEARIDKQGYDRGVKETRAEVAERDNDALKEAIVKKDKLTARVRELESSHATETATLTNNLRKEMINEIHKRETIIAGLRAGSIVLHDPFVSAPGVGDCKPGGGATAGTAGSGTDGAGGGQLSGQTSEFLVSEANRADTLARKTTALQAQVIADRKACLTPLK